MLSQSNQKRLAERRLPVVDAIWLLTFPEDRPLLGQTIPVYTFSDSQMRNPSDAEPETEIRASDAA